MWIISQIDLLTYVKRFMCVCPCTCILCLILPYTAFEYCMNLQEHVCKRSFMYVRMYVLYAQLPCKFTLVHQNTVWLYVNARMQLWMSTLVHIYMHPDTYETHGASQKHIHTYMNACKHLHAHIQLLPQTRTHTPCLLSVWITRALRHSFVSICAFSTLQNLCLSTHAWHAAFGQNAGCSLYKVTRNVLCMYARTFLMHLGLCCPWVFYAVVS